MRYKQHKIDPKPRNPSPTITPEFEARRYAPATDLPKNIEMGKKPVTTKFPAKVQEILLDTSKVRDRSAYIRRAVLEQMRKDGLISESYYQGFVSNHKQQN